MKTFRLLLIVSCASLIAAFVVAVVAFTLSPRVEQKKTASPRPGLAGAASGTPGLNAGASGTPDENTKVYDGKPDEFSEVDHILNSLTSGYAEYLAPDTLEVGSEATVTLKIGKVKDEVVKAIEELRQSTGGQTGGGTLKITTSMTAQLRGSGFKITPDLPIEEVIGSSEPGMWTWNIEALDGDDWFPSRSVKRHLTVLAFAIVTLDKASHSKLMNTWQKDIEITITWPKWFHKGVEMGKDLWWLGVVLLGVIGAVVGKRKFTANSVSD